MQKQPIHGLQGLQDNEQMEVFNYKLSESYVGAIIYTRKMQIFVAVFRFMENRIGGSL